MGDWSGPKWVAEQTRLQASYPHSTFYFHSETASRYCEIMSWPVPAPHELSLVIADLEKRRDVGIRDHGQVSHLPDCRGEHRLENIALSLIIVPQTWVRLRLDVPEPPARPGVWLIDPPIGAEVTPDFPHRNADDSGCILYPTDRAWDPARGDGPLEYLRLAAPWVVKALIWLATRKTRNCGIWVGPDASGDPRDDLDALAPTDVCVCRSGKPFGVCHRPELLAIAIDLNLRRIPRQPAGTGRYIPGVLAQLRRQSPLVL